MTFTDNDAARYGLIKELSWRLSRDMRTGCHSCFDGVASKGNPADGPSNLV